jgi:hypothetical protein
MRTRLFLVAAAVGTLPLIAAAQQIVVGPNVQISAARARDAHSEPVIASDPNHAERLIAASHIAHHDTVGTKSIAYVSFDTGKTWAVSLDKRDSTITADAAVAYGVDGSALFATLARWGMYRSRDGAAPGIHRRKHRRHTGGIVSISSPISARVSIMGVCT